MATPASESRFDNLYRSHAEAIRRYCLRRLGAAHATDAAADVFVVLWRRIEDCPTGEEARMWIFGIARRVVANRRRGLARSASLVDRVSAVPRPDEPGPEAVVIRRDEYRQLDAALEKLPSRYRDVLILAEWDGLDRESIAQLEGVSRAAIDQRISRAYRKLARLMNRQSSRDQVFVVPQRAEEGGDA